MTVAIVFFRTFGALFEVHFLHAIYHFKAQEVKNPTLQTVYKLELKWGRYGLLKTTTSSWRTNSHLANLELQRAKLKPNLQKWFCNLRTYPGSNSTRMYHIRNRLPPLPPGWHPEIYCATHSIRCLTSGIQEPDGRGGVSTSPDIHIRMEIF